MDEVMDEVSEGIKGGDKLDLSDTVKVNGEMNGACDESMEVSDTLSKSPAGVDAGNEDEPANDSSPEDAAEDDVAEEDAAEEDAAEEDAAEEDAAEEDAAEEDVAEEDAAEEDEAEDTVSPVPNDEDVDGEDEPMEVDSNAREVPNKECDTSSSEVPLTSIDKSEDNLEESLNNGPSAQSSSNVNSEVDGDKVDEDSIKDDNDKEEELEESLEKETNEDGDIGSEQSGVSDKKVDIESSEKESNCEQNVGNSESDDKTSENDRTLQNGGAATPDGSEDPKSSEKADETTEETTPEKDDSNENKEEDGGDGEDTTPTKKGKGKKKADSASVTLTPRRSSRNLNKQKSYVEDKDDLTERDDGSDIEEITMVDPLAVSSDLTRENKENSKARNSRGGPNKTIVVNDTKHLVEIASGSSKSAKGVKKEPTLVIIDTNSILSGRGPIPAQQQHTLHKPPQRSQLQITPAHPIHSTTITPSYSVVPDSWHQQQQPSHSSSSSNSPRIPASSTITPVKPPIILPSLTDDMYVVEAPSFIVPYVYEKPPVKSLKDFIETLQENIKTAKEAEKIRKEEAEKSKKEEAEKSKKENEEKEKKDAEEGNKKVEEDQQKVDREKADEKADEGKKKEVDKEDGDEVKKDDTDVKAVKEEDEKEVEACEKSKESSQVTDKTNEADDGEKKKEATDDQTEVVADKDNKSKDEVSSVKDETSKKTSGEEEKMEVDTESTKEKDDSKDITEDTKKDDVDKEKADDTESKKEKDGVKDKQVNGKGEKEDSKEEGKEGESGSKIEKVEESKKEEEKTVKEESKDKKPTVEDKGEETTKDVKILPSEKEDVKPDSEVKDSPKSEESKKPTSYFENPLGKFFIQIGINLVQEHVQTDLLRSQKKKREREGGKGGVTTQMAISSLEQTLEFSKENNEPFHLKQKKCDFCNFKTESALVMAHHMETPHMRNYVYRCNFCPMEVRSPHDILFHMEAEHNVRGRLERGPAFHQCPSCSFEDNQKGKLTRHLVSCQKRYRPEKNQEPPLDWEPPAKIPRVSRNRPGFPMAGAAAAGVPGLPGVTKTPPMMGQPHPLLPKLGPGATLMGQTTLGAVGTIGRGRGRPPMQGRYVPDMKQAQVIQQQVPRPMSAQTLRQGMLYRPSAGPQSQVLLPTSYHIGNQIYQNAAGKVQTKVQQQPSISITPLPRQTTVTPPNAHSANMTGIKPGHPGGGKATFVICEICDGYIKDLEQLRSHMQWIHKVKIHPKMIFNRPPLNCQKCQFRFFTDQGLERHLLGSHGLVTSSMQEAANKGKDGGRCPVCGRVYQWKLLNHVARDHSMTLKPAHLSYKCTVCTATFGMYKQFENHVYTAHSVVAKRVMEKKPGAGGAGGGGSGGASSGGSSSQGVAGRAVTSQRPAAASPQGESLLKPLKINDEITIIPQPARARPGTTNRPTATPAQTKGGAEDRERPSRAKDTSKDGAEVIDLEGAAGKDALSAVQERLRRRTSLEVSQVEPEQQPPNKKSRKD